jgi:uncharacterized membrane protein
MAFRGFFSDLTPKRRVALMVAIVLWIATAYWFAFGVFQVPASQWPPYTAVVFAGFGALSTAVVVVEMVRGISSRLSSWSDERHFFWVGLVFAGLFAMQYTGIRIALSSYGA